MKIRFILCIFNYRVTDNAGTTISSVNVDRVSDLYIGKATGLSTPGFAKFKIMSLAIREVSLSPDQINSIYTAGKAQQSAFCIRNLHLSILL